MKKLLFVNNTMGIAGAERVLISVFNVIDKTKYNVDFLSTVARGELFNRIPKGINILNRQVHTDSVMTAKGAAFLGGVILKALLKRFYFIKYIPYVFMNVYYQLRHGQLLLDKLFWLAIADNTQKIDTEYDLAIAYVEGASTYYVAKHVKAKRKAAFVHVNYKMAGYLRELDYKYYKDFDEIFCVSQGVLAGFLEIYPEFESKTQVLLNTVLPEEIRECAQAGIGFTDGFEGTRLVTVARLHPQKALDIAIEAMSKLIDMGYSDLKWYVLGDGFERSRLEKLIAQHKLQEKFILMGVQDNPYPFMAQADIYVQPSHYEGWSIALIEALILHKPTIAADFTGVREQIKNGVDGIIIEDLDADKLSLTIKKLVDDKELRDKLSDNLHKGTYGENNDLWMLYDLADSYNHEY